jgi:pimeloyl-ACP methyl ester carboxylesterase
MNHVSSADGTRIAHESIGSGPAVVIVNGAFSTAADAGGLAGELANAGFTAVSYDRRARAGSGDTRPYAPEREADDLAAVVNAVGGRAAVVGHSSGAVLALFAASLGVGVEHLFLSEPPFRYGENEPPHDLAERLQKLVDDNRAADAVMTFQLEGVGLPPQLVEQIHASPMFPSLVALAQSAVYDATLTRDVSTPTAAMLDVTAPVTVLSGVETFPFLHASAERLAGLLPLAEFVEVPESIGHRLDPAATARIIAERLTRR